MPVEIVQMNSEVEVVKGEAESKGSQIDNLAEVVREQLEEARRESTRNLEATQIRRSAIPQSKVVG